MWATTRKESVLNACLYPSYLFASQRRSLYLVFASSSDSLKSNEEIVEYDTFSGWLFCHMSCAYLFREGLLIKVCIKSDKNNHKHLNRISSLSPALTCDVCSCEAAHSQVRVVISFTTAC